MKKALMKDSVKEIKNTYKRFISILLMAFLGVGFFAGIKATSPDMVNTIDAFYKKQNMYDMQVLSTMGLTDDDIEELSKIENVEQVVGTYEVDGKLDIDNKEIVVKNLCIEDINTPTLIDGRLPENESECVVEELFLTQNDKKIGDKINLEIENTSNDEGEEIEYLKQTELTIVGSVKSPLYISRDRGTSTLGSGRIDYYIYLAKENINASEIYTSIYLKIKNADELETSSEEYEELVENVKNKIEEIKEERQNARHDAIVDVANQKVIDAENELNTQKQENQEKIDDAQAEIDSGKSKINQGENELKAQEQKAKNEFANADNQIASAKAEIEKNEQELANKEQEANAQFAELEKQKAGLQTQLEQVNAGISTLTTNYEQIVEALKNPNLSEQEKQSLEQTKEQLEEQIAELNQNKVQLEAGIAQIDAGIQRGKNEIESAKAQIQNAKQQLSEQEKVLANTKSTTYAQIESAKRELRSSKAELQQGENELAEKRQEFEEKIQEAETKLIDAKKDIDDIENPKWYILDRYGNAGYNSFIQDTKSVANIGQVFPAVFFIVAVLISLTSMTRMVEEQRMGIGTLKALGYNKMQIASKYLIYAALASVIGGILGMCVGFVILPKIIWMMYSMMYEIGNIQLGFNIYYGTMRTYIN